MIKCDDAICARKGGLFKYVRMADNSIRFISFDRPWIPNHSDMVRHGEQPFSAGTVEIDAKTKDIQMDRPDSMTLGIKSAPDDLATIKEILWPPLKKRPLPANPDRDQVFKLAKQGVHIQAIAGRISSNYDRVRRMIERGEQRGDLPAGTLSKLGVLPKKSKPAPPVSLRVYAPARKVAADLGHCSCCSDPTEVSVETKDDKLRLCGAHARDLAGSIELALRDAATTRTRFNGKFQGS